MAKDGRGVPFSWLAGPGMTVLESFAKIPFLVGSLGRKVILAAPISTSLSPIRSRNPLVTQWRSAEKQSQDQKFGPWEYNALCGEKAHTIWAVEQWNKLL
jgi:hypothetical protein